MGLSKEIINRIYSEKLDYIFSSSDLMFWIWAGKGMGKGLFLDIIAERMAVEHKNMIFLSFDCKKASAKEIINGIDNRPNGENFTLFFHNIEYVYHESSIINFLDHINKTKNFPGNNKGIDRIVASSRFTPTMAVEKFDDAFSRISWKPTELNPWESGWKSLIKDQLMGFISEDEIIESWHEALIEITGNHPAFLLPAFKEIDKLNKSGEIYQITDKEDIIYLLSTEVYKYGMPVITRAIELLQKEQPTTHNYLINYARKKEMDTEIKEDEVPLSEKLKIHEIACNYGLGFKSRKSPKELLLPGLLVTNAFSSLKPAGGHIEEGIKKIFIEPNHLKSDRGELRITTQSGTHSILFSGQNWELLKILYENNYKPITKNDLKKKLNQPTIGAVNSIIQRTRDFLKQKGVYFLIESLRNHGYYINSKAVFRNEL